MTLVDLDRPTVRSRRLDTLPVAIIGAGPIGLAAAANLVERGIDFVIYEAGDSIADSMRRWSHIRLFSPWKFLVDPASRRLLEAEGWVHPDESRLPYGRELIDDYLVPLAALEPIASRTRTGVEVVAVSREGMDRTRTARRADTPFIVRTTDATGATVDVAAGAVIDASGTYRNANSLASSGLDPLGIDQVAAAVTHALPDVLGRDRGVFAGRRVTVVGAGHSAANTLLNLAALAREEPQTRITWLIRNASAVRVSSSDDDQLAARATIGRRVDDLVASGRIEVLDRFEIGRLERVTGDAGGAPVGVRLVGTRAGESAVHETDVVVNATGFRPNLDMLREVRLELDDVVEAPKRLAPLIDPNVHSCGTVEPHGIAELRQPEDGFFIVGMKSYGRAPTFLLATGYEQVRSIAAWMAGDVAAANAVQLVLPSTGVCSTSLGDSIGVGPAGALPDGTEAGAGCCR